MRGKETGTAKRFAKELLGTLAQDSSFQRSVLDLEPLLERFEEIENAVDSAYIMLVGMVVLQTVSVASLFWLIMS